VGMGTVFTGMSGNRVQFLSPCNVILLFG